MFKKKPFEIDYNPMLRRREERKKALTPEQIELLDKFPEVGENLYVLKRTRREKHDGDIFVCSINGKVFYYGKILNACVENKSDSWINGSILACIFREKTTEKNLKNYKGDYDNLLMAPFIVPSQYWSRGYFETIGNESLTKKDKNLDYGFYFRPSIHKNGAFYNEKNEILDHFPKYYSHRGINTYVGVYNYLRQEAIFDPTLLTMD